MTPRPLTGKGLERTLAGICEQAGLDPAGSTLIKFTNNAVFKLASAPVVVRIAGSQTVRDRIDKVIDVARWLEEHKLRAVRLLTEVEQPIQHDGHLATLWRSVPNDGRSPSGLDLGRILRHFHELPSPGRVLPQWHPTGAIRTRIAESDWLTPSDQAFLDEQCEELEDTLARVTTVLPDGPIHGDSFLGNLIPARGGPVICDFDSVSIGPREWDLTPVAVGRLRFDYRSDAHGQLSEAYGFDVTSWTGFGAFRKLRELQLVTSVLPVLPSNPGLVGEWRHRFASFRQGDISAVWHPYT